VLDRRFHLSKSAIRRHRTEIRRRRVEPLALLGRRRTNPIPGQPASPLVLARRHTISGWLLYKLHHARSHRRPANSGPTAPAPASDVHLAGARSGKGPRDGDVRYPPGTAEAERRRGKTTPLEPAKWTCHATEQTSPATHHIYRAWILCHNGNRSSIARPSLTRPHPSPNGPSLSRPSSSGRGTWRPRAAGRRRRPRGHRSPGATGRRPRCSRPGARATSARAAARSAPPTGAPAPPPSHPAAAKDGLAPSTSARTASITSRSASGPTGRGPRGRRRRGRSPAGWTASARCCASHPQRPPGSPKVVEPPSPRRRWRRKRPAGLLILCPAAGHRCRSGGGRRCRCCLR
jgi:hypothetical protein